MLGFHMRLVLLFSKLACSDLAAGLLCHADHMSDSMCVLADCSSIQQSRTAQSKEDGKMTPKHPSVACTLSLQACVLLLLCALSLGHLYPGSRYGCSTTNAARTVCCKYPCINSCQCSGFGKCFLVDPLNALMQLLYSFYQIYFLHLRLDDDVLAPQLKKSV